MTENAIARIEGKVVGINDQGLDAKGRGMVVINLEIPGGKFTYPLRANTNLEGAVLVKSGQKLKVGDRIVSDITDSEYISKKTGKPAVSHWVKGTIEVMDEKMFKGNLEKQSNKLDDYQPEEQEDEGQPDNDSDFHTAGEDGPKEARKHEASLLIQDSKAVFREQFGREVQTEGDMIMLSSVFKFMAWRD